MKKRALLLVLSIIFSLSLNAQYYNRWSIDVNGGINVPSTSSFSSGYFTKLPGLWSGNAGVRYMFNNKFGIRLGVGYDQFKPADASQSFDSKILSANLSGVINFGRLFVFDDWTERVGLLGQFGVGYGQFTESKFTGKDELVVLNFGLTPQIKINDRLTFLLGANFHTYLHQQYTFNGERLEKDLNSKLWRHSNFQGFNFTATAGIQINLGSKERVHADWFFLDEKVVKKEEEEAKEKAKNAKDNIIARGGSNIAENKKIGDDPDKNLAGNVNGEDGDNGDETGNNTNIVNNNSRAETDAAKQLIEQGYVTAYFGFNSTKPNEGSMWAVGFVANYLRQNPDAKVNIVGYTDEVGNIEYNQALSKKRADAVKQLLVDMGVETSRLSSHGKGIDKISPAKSANARQLVRRVVFELSGNEDSESQLASSKKTSKKISKK